LATLLNDTNIESRPYPRVSYVGKSRELKSRDIGVGLWQMFSIRNCPSNPRIGAPKKTSIESQTTLCIFLPFGEEKNRVVNLIFYH